MTDNATGTEIDPAIRDRLALALDVDDLVAAIRLGRTFKDYFGVAKIGLEALLRRRSGGDRCDLRSRVQDLS